MYFLLFCGLISNMESKGKMSSQKYKASPAHIWVRCWIICMLFWWIWNHISKCSQSINVRGLGKFHCRYLTLWNEGELSAMIIHLSIFTFFSTGVCHHHWYINVDIFILYIYYIGFKLFLFLQAVANFPLPFTPWSPVPSS